MRITEIHRHAELLRETVLYLAASPRNQVHQITAWLQACMQGGDPAQLRSYLREFGSQLFSVIPDIEPAGIAPEFFSTVRTSLAWVRASSPGLFGDGEYDSSARALTQAERSIRCFLGDPAFELDATSRAAFLQNVDRESKEREILEQYVRFLERIEPSRVLAFTRVAEAWDAAVRAEIGCAKIPLVEQDITNGSIPDFQPFVSCPTLHVHLHPLEKGAAEDRINFSHRQQQDADALARQLHEGLRAVRRAAQAYVKPTVDDRFMLTLSLQGPGLACNGQSLGLGYSAAVFSALSHQSHDRKYFLPAGASVFSGLIAGAGEILHLEAGQAAVKARALWYTPFNQFVVSKGNESEVEDVLLELSAAHPNRRLSVLPVRRLEDVIDNRRITVQQSFTAVQRTAKRFERHQKRIALSSTALLIMLVLGYLLLIADFDTNPAHVTIRDNDFLMQNKNGKTLWRKPVGPPGSHVSESEIREIGRTYFLVKVFDLDDDGSNEVVLGHHKGTRGFSDSVYCYNADGSVKWKRLVGMAIRTDEGDYAKDMEFKVHGIVILPSDASHETRIAVTACNSAYSNVVTLFDIHGKKLAEYVHLGLLLQPTVLRNTMPGKSLLLLCGTNNAWKQPVVVVLDPDRMNGVSPQQGTYILRSPKLPAVEEVWYIRFPIPAVQKILGNELYPAAFILERDDSLITIETTHGFKPTQPDAKVTLQYKFALQGMQPVSLHTTSPFDDVMQTCFSDGSLPFIPRKQYTDSLVQRLDFWDGERYVHTPTIHRRYLRALEDARPGAR